MSKLIKRAAKQVERRTKQPIKKKSSSIDKNKLVPTGSIILNLACSDHWQGGYSTGKIINIVGDSSAGKSLLALTGLAVMATMKRFDDYLLIYDDVEAANDFDLEKLFGKKIAKRIMSDSTFDGEPLCSDTIEDAYSVIQQLLDSDQKFIYILDSLDSLTSKEEKFRAKEIAKRKDPSGTYKTQRVRMLTEMLRQIRKRLKQTDSLFIVISQVRDNLNPSMFGSTKTRAGGKALRHHSCHEIWLSVTKRLKKQVKGKQFVIGNEVEFSVHKNKLTGRQFIKQKFYTDYRYGIDDIRSCVVFLWSYMSYNFVKKGKISKAIQFVEENDLAIGPECQAVWDDLNECLETKRKPRFG
jgi:RecA/RadA recombinase